MIRQATQADLSTFLKLWRAMLRSLLKQGGDILVTKKTLEFFSALFIAYTSGTRRGLVLMDKGDAVLLVGEPLSDIPYDTINDPMAHAWGIYISPERRSKGLSKDLHNVAVDLLIEMGFKSVTAGSLLKNEIGHGRLIMHGFTFNYMGGVLRINETEKE